MLNKMMRGLLITLLMMSCLPLFAQRKVVTGTVTNSENKEPLPGVTVGVKGGTTNAVTNDKGEFTISVASEETVLKFTTVGFTYQEHRVGTATNLTIDMKKGNNSLDEVVVVGYGQQKKASLTGSVVSINPKEVEDLPVTNLGAALQGRFPGVGVSGGTDRPGSNATITIRNPVMYSKDGGTTSPLYVIDDVIRSQEDFNLLDPTEVENISILKDAAASVYGARAGNGVIVITTRRGKIGKTLIGVNSSYAINDATSLPKMMTGFEQAQYLNARTMAAHNFNADRVGSDNGYLADNAYYTNDELAYYKNNNTNWLGMAWKPSHFMRHAINVSGGSDRATFFASATYLTQDGNLPNINVDKWTFRASADVKLAKGFTSTISVSGDLGTRKQYLLKQGGENPENDMKGLLYTPGFTPAYINGLPVQISTATNQNTIDAFHFFEVQRLNNYNNNRNSGMNVQATLNYQVPFVQGLSAKVQFAKVLDNQFPKQFGTRYRLYRFATAGEHNHLYRDSVLGSTIVTNGNRVYFKPSYNDAYQLDAYLTYSRKFGRHSINAVAIVEQAESQYDDVQAYTEDPTEGAPDISRFAFGAYNVYETASEDGRLGFIGKFNYNFADKYILDLGFRKDASGNFAPEYRWGFFPSASAAWVISEEKFFSRVRSVNFLKMRLSAGRAGTDATQAYRYSQRYTPGITSGAVFGGNSSRYVGTKPETLPNYAARWDDALKFNFAFDAAFLDSRLTTTVEYFHNHLYNQLTTLTSSVPLLIGSTIAAENYSTTNTYGYELSLGWQDKIGKNFSYNINPFFTWSDATAVKTDVSKGLIGTYQDPIGKSTDMGLLGYRYVGMFRSQAEVDAFLVKNPAYTVFGTKPGPGSLYYEDIRGAKDPLTNKFAGPDGKIDENDQDYIKSKASNHYGFGFNLGASFKGFKLDFVISGSFGGINGVEGSARKLGTATSNRPQFWNDVWTPDNTDAKYPNPFYSSSYDVTSAFWFKSSTQVRMRNANLSYGIPQAASKRIGFQSLKVYVTATNPFNLYNPYDYRDNGIGAFDVYPLLRTVAFGINATL